MDFNEYKESWKAFHNSGTIVDKARLKNYLKAADTSKNAIQRYLKMEWIIAFASILFFITITYLADTLDSYFYKLFFIILIGCLALTLRMNSTLVQFKRVKFTEKIQYNLVEIRNHLRKSLHFSYWGTSLIIALLILMSLNDQYFLGLNLNVQWGVILYFLVVGLLSFYLTNRFYGKTLKELDEILEESDMLTE
ncbi:MAG: hypothetical protein EA362_13600 [Saprospirales bacterium]|nr:MAG: hypothetical protein EA362_13600 [Saprospirales bacterium]